MNKPTAAQQPSMLTNQVIVDGLGYFLRGGMCIKNGHLPPLNQSLTTNQLPSNGHIVPNDFIGICVATNANPAVDTYVIEQLNDLGIKQVRLDFSYGDLTSFNARFLQRLIADNFAVTLHLVQPFTAAKNMLQIDEQQIWRNFLQAVLNTFGSQIKQIEIGTTVNRRRWSGYNFDGFLQTWDIAYAEIKARNITLIGPNIQDFEPFYNVSLLKHFKTKNQLPDIVSNNLFSERVIEPEGVDFRIFKYRWTRIFNYNLIKKARILKKISVDFGVSRLISPVAFWAIYRIQRMLYNGAQKQADYAARYFLLLSASGALAQANWGALICQREGLINDGLSEADYPDLERVAHYKQADGSLENYQTRPSFNAVKTVAKLIQGAHYIKPIATSNGLEIHHFKQGSQHIHAAWVINGKAEFLSALYSESTLKIATILHRDGMPLTTNLDLITETPIYLIWDNEDAISLVSQVATQPKLTSKVSIDRHTQGQHYFKFEQNGWQGLVLARNNDEAQLLMQTLHPEQLQSPNKDKALRHARNAIWAVADPRKPLQQLTIKQPVKMYPHKAFLDRFKPSKAKRSWNGAMELMRRNIATAPPVAYFEKVGDLSLKQNFYVCEFVKADCTVGQLFSAFASGENSYLGVTTEEVFVQLAQFCNNIHNRLIYFRDLSGGNVLVKILAENQLQFSLIDTARLHSFNHPPFPVKHRIADLTRICHKLDWKNRERFMQIYMGLTGRKFTWQHKFQFHCYDFKVGLKRRIGRKGIKRLIKKFKGEV